MYGRSPSKRGVGCQFGPDVTRRFLENNKLDYIIRSHEVKVNNCSNIYYTFSSKVNRRNEILMKKFKKNSIDDLSKYGPNDLSKFETSPMKSTHGKVPSVVLKKKRKMDMN